MSKKSNSHPKQPLYVLPHGIEVIGEYLATEKNPYVRLRIRPHAFFPDAKIVFGGIYVRKNRAVLASQLGRALSKSEHAHHEDEVKTNDSANNIESLSAVEHNRHHKTGSSHRADSRAKTSATLRRKYASGEIVKPQVRGSAQGTAKLTERQAKLIKHSTEPTKVLVDRYGVSRTVIKQIRNGSTWKHIT